MKTAGFWLRRSAPALLGLGIGGLALVASAAAGVPANAIAVAAVFPPWWTPSRAFMAASSVGNVVGVGAGSSILIVRSGSSELPARLVKAGAVLLLNPLGAGACGERRLGWA